MDYCPITNFFFFFSYYYYYWDWTVHSLLHQCLSPRSITCAACARKPHNFILPSISYTWSWNAWSVHKRHIHLSAISTSWITFSCKKCKTKRHVLEGLCDVYLHLRACPGKLIRIHTMQVTYWFCNHARFCINFAVLMALIRPPNHSSFWSKIEKCCGRTWIPPSWSFVQS